MALPCLLAAGCAVTTIDVDVYKGPLVNDEDVQVAQTAAMVAGARPLLLALRNELEASYRLKVGVTPHQVPQGIREAFVRMPEVSTATTRPSQWWFYDVEAVRVNGILGLYEDAVPGVWDLVKPVIQARADYLRAVEEAAAVTRSGLTVSARPDSGFNLGSAISGEAQMLQEKGLLNAPPEKATTRPLISTSHGRPPEELLVSSEPATPEDRLLYEAARHQQEKLVALWKAAITLATHLDDPAFQQMSPRAEFQAEVASIIVELTDPSRLVVALYGSNPPADVNVLKKSLDNEIQSVFAEWTGEPQEGTWKPVLDELRGLLLSRPVQTATQLRAAFEYFRGKTWTPAPTLPPGLAAVEVRTQLSRRSVAFVAGRLVTRHQLL